MANQQNAQWRFVELLTMLTKSGKLEWARSQNETGFIYCLTPNELIIFESSGDTGSLVDPAENVVGVRSKCRNVSYIWLQPTAGFTELVTLLRDAPVDDAAFIEFRRRSHSYPIRSLEALL